MRRVPAPPPPRRRLRSPPLPSAPLLPSIPFRCALSLSANSSLRAPTCVTATRSYTSKNSEARTELFGGSGRGVAMGPTSSAYPSATAFSQGTGGAGPSGSGDGGGGYGSALPEIDSETQEGLQLLERKNHAIDEQLEVVAEGCVLRRRPADPPAQPHPTPRCPGAARLTHPRHRSCSSSSQCPRAQVDCAQHARRGEGAECDGG